MDWKWYCRDVADKIQKPVIKKTKLSRVVLPRYKSATPMMPGYSQQLISFNKNNGKPH